MAVANKDPLPGKITFLIKVIRHPDVDFNFKVENIRPKTNKHALEVHMVSSGENFELYEIDTNSILKKIAIHMLVEDTSIQSSR